MNKDRFGIVCHCVGCSSPKCENCNYSACLRAFERNHLYDYLESIMDIPTVNQVMITYAGCTFKFMKIRKDYE